MGAWWSDTHRRSLVFCHFSKLFEAVKSRNNVDDAIAAPPAASIEPFQIHFAFTESRTSGEYLFVLSLVEKDHTGSRGRLKVSHSAAPRSLWPEPRHWIKYQNGGRHNGEESAKGGRRLDCYSKCSWLRQIKRFSPGGRKSTA